MSKISVKTKPGSYVWTRNGAPDIESIDVDVSPDGEVRISGSSPSRNLIKSGFFIDVEAMDKLCNLWKEYRNPIPSIIIANPSDIPEEDFQAVKERANELLASGLEFEQIKEELIKDFKRIRVLEIQRAGDVPVLSHPPYPINLDPAPMNYKHAVKLKHEKVRIEIDCQHFYWDRWQKKYLRSYPDGSVFDVVIIRRNEDGTMLGLSESNATYVFTQGDVIDG